LAPDSPEAALALAECALARHDVTLASSLLEPEVAGGYREPRLVAAFLRLMTARTWGERTVWTPSSGESAVAVGREALAAHPEDEALARDFKGFCEALPPSACAATPAVAAPAGP
jgi:hypothetical protein